MDGPLSNIYHLPYVIFVLKDEKQKRIKKGNDVQFTGGGESI